MERAKLNNRMELCLCPKCARQFYSASTQRITRADPVQVILDMCDCCRTRRGYDFILAVPVKIRRTGCGILQ